MNGTRTWDVLRRDHAREDVHHRGARLPEVILGGQDGLVNVLGVILGVAAASGDARIILAAGLAATFAESISMAAVAYTTRRTDADLYESEIAREKRHIQKVPSLERAEIRELYRRKGFEGALLEQVVETLTRNQEVWLDEMMAEEHRLAPVSTRRSLSAALVVGAAAIVGSFVPLVPFMLLPVRTATWVSFVAAGVVLLAFGMLKARWTVGSPWRRGLELMAIGLASALGGYAVGLLFDAG